MPVLVCNYSHITTIVLFSGLFLSLYLPKYALHTYSITQLCLAQPLRTDSVSPTTSRSCVSVSACRVYSLLPQYDRSDCELFQPVGRVASKSTTVLFIWTQTACRVQYVVCSEREYIHPVSSRTQRENIQLKILFHWEDYLHFLYNWNFSPVQSISGKCLLLFSSLNCLFSVSFSISLVK